MLFPKSLTIFAVNEIQRMHIHTDILILQLGMSLLNLGSRLARLQRKFLWETEEESTLAPMGKVWKIICKGTLSKTTTSAGVVRKDQKGWSSMPVLQPKFGQLPAKEH